MSKRWETPAGLGPYQIRINRKGKEIIRITDRHGHLETWNTIVCLFCAIKHTFGKNMMIGLCRFCLILKSEQYKYKMKYINLPFILDLLCFFYLQKI